MEMQKKKKPEMICHFRGRIEAWTESGENLGFKIFGGGPKITLREFSEMIWNNYMGRNKEMKVWHNGELILRHRNYGDREKINFIKAAVR